MDNTATQEPLSDEEYDYDQFKDWFNEQPYTRDAIIQNHHRGKRYYFVHMNNDWHAYPDCEWWDTRAVVIPGHIPTDALNSFMDWREDVIAKAHKEGRKDGESAMRQAIRTIIGAAPLTPLD